jgi:hypothetical protein
MGESHQARLALFRTPAEKGEGNGRKTNLPVRQPVRPDVHWCHSSCTHRLGLIPVLPMLTLATPFEDKGLAAEWNK